MKKIQSNKMYSLEWTGVCSNHEVTTFIQSKMSEYEQGPILFKFEVLVVELDIFLKELENLYSGIKIVKYENINLIFINDSAFDIIIDSKVRGERSYCKTYLMVRDVFHPIVNIIDKYSNARFDDHDFYTEYFYVNEKGLQNITIVKNTDNLSYIIEELYPGINIPNLYNSFMNSKESVLILLGKPGVGKTTLIKYFMRELAVDNYNKANQTVKNFDKDYPSIISSADEDDILFSYAKGNEVLSKEEFWAQLTSNSSRMLILDDLDFALLPRDKSGNEFMSNFLSFADGIFDNDVKIVMTTNLAFGDIDKALLRPGRCFDILDLQPLDYSQALHVWTDILFQKEKTFQDNFSGGNIFQSELMSYYEKIVNIEKNADYLIDKNISVRHTLSKRRKVGF